MMGNSGRKIPDEAAGSVIRAILEGTATTVGEQFFAALVENLAKALKTHCSWIAEYIEQTNSLRTIAFWADGRLQDNLTVELTGTPCEIVIRQKDLVHFPDALMEIFPESELVRTFHAVSYMGVPILDTSGNIFGNLAVLDNQPMPRESKSEAVFRIFAARGASELQRIRAEQDLRQREEKYRRIVECTSQGFILLDKHFEIAEVNTAFCQLLDMPPEQIIGRSPLDFATEEFQNFLTINRTKILHGECRDFEGTMVSSHTGETPILVHGDTLRDDNGDILGTMAFITNMTEAKRSLRLAAEVQRGLLPADCLLFHGIEIAGRMEACEEVGGDYFDYLEDSEAVKTRLDVVVGDVTGHGVDAALLMTSARAFLRMCVRQRVDISRIVTELNRHLAEDFASSGRFMTLFYLSIDRIRERISWVRAGHDAAVIYDPVTDEFAELRGTGLALGVDRGYLYEKNVWNGLRSGQVIAIGTDGIWEACNREHQRFGKHRLLELLRTNAHRPVRLIIDAVFSELKNFTHGLKQTDDITMVVLKVQDLPPIACDWQI